MHNKLTEEQLRRFANDKDLPEQWQSMARELLERRQAEKEQKPVAFTDAEELTFPYGYADMWQEPHGFGLDIPLYTHPPETINAELLEALQLSLSAMEHMGNILNDLDAVDAEDVAITTPAFDAARVAIAKALGESND
ncbi:hypothetical protein [Limnobaculum xujianqingii]|uniref:hypothetical protein n=1 Tax=Limnobaculum xujianqingii TaxID=2738837 RepID=UPI00112D4A2E|nr:hypothetical protein [Limnobaculum xujianqingii]